jgi:ferredoxin
VLTQASSLHPLPSAPTRQGGRAVHWGGVAGLRTGEGPSLGNVPRHTVVINNPNTDQTVTVEVPEDRWEGLGPGLS